jgi:hypothetical protein
MRGIKQCPRCNSERLIPDVRIIDRGHNNSARDLSVEVYEQPDALIFKGTHLGILQATICADCGNAELTVTNAEELYDAYVRARQNLPQT